MSTQPLLFDTHAWLWIVAGNEKIHSKILNLVESARENHLLYLSEISLWEVSMLVKKERITLSQPVLPWLKSAIKLSKIHLVNLTPEIVVESTTLPGEFHGDPADRIIVATARIMDLTILTRDQKILSYGKNKRTQAIAL